MIQMFKTCYMCKIEKPLSEFNKNRTNCRECQKAYCKVPGNMIKENDRKKEYSRRLLSVIIGNYGGQCACCGCDEQSFLQIDHVNNDGNKERAENGLTGRKLYNHIVNNNFPNHYQILCANCHQSKTKLGKCVHQCSVEDLLKNRYVR